MIFTYMGAPENMPLLPRYEWADLQPGQLFPVKSFLECNYLQGIEGDFDSSHTSFLHNNNLQNAERLKARRRADVGSRGDRLRHAGDVDPQVRRGANLRAHEPVHHAVVQHRARPADGQVRRRRHSRVSFLGAHR